MLWYAARCKCGGTGALGPRERGVGRRGAGGVDSNLQPVRLDDARQRAGTSRIACGESLAFQF